MYNQIEITVTFNEGTSDSSWVPKNKMNEENKRKTYAPSNFFFSLSLSLLLFFGSLYNEPLWPFKSGELKEMNEKSRETERVKATREKKM